MDGLKRMSPFYFHGISCFGPIVYSGLLYYIHGQKLRHLDSLGILGKKDTTHTHTKALKKKTLGKKSVEKFFLEKATEIMSFSVRC